MLKVMLDEVRKELPDVSDGFIRNLLAAFLFKGDDVLKRLNAFLVEKSRLVLANFFKIIFLF